MPPSPSPVPGTRRHDLAALDGLRGVAALLVLGYHLARCAGLVTEPLLAGLKGGVTIFFVLSGFLLYRPLARAIQTGEALPDWRPYAERRAVRILPAYWVALVVLGLGPLSDALLSPRWWAFFGLAQIYNPDTILAGLGVAWSLCVEVSFYALLPPLARLLARLARRTSPVRGQLLPVAALAAASLGVRLACSGSPGAGAPPEHVVLLTALPGLFDWFALGMALAVLERRGEATGWVDRLWRTVAGHGTACWAGAAALYALAAEASDGDGFLPLLNPGTHVLLGFAAALLLAPLLGSTAGGVPGRILRCPPARWLGTISYGVYLWHVPLLQVLQRALGVTDSPSSAAVLLPLGAAGVLGAVALGAASWYLVERPAIAYFSRRRARDAAARAVAVEVAYSRL